MFSLISKIVIFYIGVLKYILIRKIFLQEGREQKCVCNYAKSCRKGDETRT